MQLVTMNLDNRLFNEMRHRLAGYDVLSSAIVKSLKNMIDTLTRCFMRKILSQPNVSDEFMRQPRDESRLHQTQKQLRPHFFCAIAEISQVLMKQFIFSIALKFHLKLH